MITRIKAVCCPPKLSSWTRTTKTLSAAINKTMKNAVENISNVIMKQNVSNHVNIHNTVKLYRNIF